MKDLQQSRRSTTGIYYGWVITIALFLALLGFFGSFYSFGVFLKPLSQEFGWTRAETSWAFALSMLVQGVTGFLAGMATDRLGSRNIMIASCLVTGLGYALIYFTSNLWQLYFFYGVLVAVGTGASWVVPVVIIPRWFVHNRGLALGIVYSSIGVGQMVMPPVLTHLVTQFGWRYSFVAMGVLVIASGIPCAILLRKRREEAESTESGMKVEKVTDIYPGTWSTRQAIALPRFWVLFAIWFFVAIPLQILIVHLVPYATDANISPSQAALLLTIMGAVVTAARIGIGWVSDLVGNKYTYWGCLFFQMAALFGILGAGGFWTFGAAAAVFGVGYGGAAIIYPKIVADFFGVKSIGAIIGVLNIGWTIGAALGPPFGGLVFDISGSYFFAFLAGGIFMGFALLLAYGLLKKK